MDSKEESFNSTQTKKWETFYSKPLKELTKLIHKHYKEEESLELEVRLGKYDFETERFEAGVSAEFFYGLLKALLRYKHWENIKEEEEKEEKQEQENLEWTITTEIYYSKCIRRIMKGKCDLNNKSSIRPSTYQKKKKISDLTMHLKNRLYDIRFGIKTELSIDPPSFQFLASEIKCVRIKYRYSFILTKAHFRIDFTKVYAGDTEAEALEQKEPTSYEIEMEYLPSTVANQEEKIALTLFINTLNLFHTTNTASSSSSNNNKIEIQLL